MCNTKKCGKCEVEKDLSEFNKNKSKKLGVSSVCKKCHSEYRKEQYQKNKEKELAQVKAYQEKNIREIPKVLKKQKTDYGELVLVEGFNAKGNRVVLTSCNECGKDLCRSQKNIDLGRVFTCNTCINDPIKQFVRKRLNNTKRRCKIKDFEYDLTFDDVMNILKENDFRCSVTNIKFDFESDEKSIFQMSIDRIDSNKGYTKDNIELVTLGYNYMKNTFPLDEVKSYLTKLKE